MGGPTTAYDVPPDEAPPAQLVAPTTRLHTAWLEAHREWGPGQHEDGFGLGPDDDVDSAAGFAAWVGRLLDQAHPERATAMGRLWCLYRWVVEEGQVVGGIALRDGPPERLAAMGHIGYGIRPSARGRGLATWALTQVLDQARTHSLPSVLLVCEDDNAASARTIERVGGVLEAVVDTAHGRARRYVVALLPPAD